jgi:hypothetical protein
MNKSSKKYLLIIDYNLSRFDDVKLMTDYAISEYSLQTILIRPNSISLDDEVASCVLDLDPRSNDFIEKAKLKLKPFINKIHAGIVFSDNAVFTGAKLLEEMKLETDSSFLAEAAYSKIKYRIEENKNKSLIESNKVFVPNFKIVHTLDELLEFALQNPEGFILKPACEGNNRGVMLLRRGDDLSQAMQSVMPYIAEGLICEELIQFEEEYSFDGISHLNFITKKLCKHSRYPVEYGQIVSGNNDVNTSELVKRAGNIANIIVGQQRGPFHNEIKLSLLKGQAAVIEPNRRPAGMRIWTLAEKVFRVNFYYLWLDRVIANKLPPSLPHPKGVAAIRMLGVPRDGKLCLPNSIIDQPDFLLQKTISLFKKLFNQKADHNWFDFRINKSNEFVLSEPRDNSDFIGQICVYVDDDGIDIASMLDEFHSCWLKIIDEYIIESCGALA